MIRRLALELDHRLGVGVAWLGRRLGYRGAALAAFATFDLVWAWSLLDPVAAQGARAAPIYHVVVSIGATVSTHSPLLPWAVGMGLVGILLGVQAWMVDDRAGFAAAIMVKVIWSAATLAAWPEAGWQILRPTIVFLTLAALVSVCAAGLPVQEE